MDAEQRAELRRLADAATPEPWYASWSGYVDAAPHIGAVTRSSFRRIEDARFTAASRQAVPELLDDLEAAEARASRLAEAVQLAIRSHENLVEFVLPERYRDEGRSILRKLADALAAERGAGKGEP